MLKWQEKSMVARKSNEVARNKTEVARKSNKVARIKAKVARKTYKVTISTNAPHVNCIIT
ncbi:hypothetical protein [Bacillus pinisoli]|uniref:hypothetical protein n=1 Tax=Bacillus pinisoli TaxID=2901866 RepID=UPI001FF6C266|nr:hypothetical protein [Bacillus pinisoli]